MFAISRAASRNAAGMERVLFGRLEVGDGTLRVETNSVARADGLRRDVKAACGDLVRHRAREHTDPRAALRRGARPRPQAEAPPPPELAQALLEFKRRQYAVWIDEAIPALGGLTPREATRQGASRRRLEVLLQDMERMEAALPAEERFDFGVVREALGMVPPHG